MDVAARNFEAAMLYIMLMKLFMEIMTTTI